ncbi:putative transcription factor bZIP family [Helianthus anomalus]
MVNGILQWIRSVFRLKPFQIKLAITRTVICFHFRGRKNGAIEKVVERRQRKTIKNRESAARSRARKQVGMLNIVGFRFIRFSFLEHFNCCVYC